nr:MAG TPA: hypothetical protein [Caudoviricetes sp.]
MLVEKVKNMFSDIKSEKHAQEVLDAMDTCTSIAKTYYHYGDSNMDDAAEDILRGDWKCAYKSVLWLWWDCGGPQNQGTDEISWAANDLVREIEIIAKSCGFYDQQAHETAPWCR